MTRLLKDEAGAVRPGHANRMPADRTRLDVPVTTASAI
jgi:hypothetical protein